MHIFLYPPQGRARDGSTRRVAARFVACVIAALVLSAPVAATAKHFGPFGGAVPVTEVNSSVADGCPIEAPNGRTLFIASVRDGTHGGNDIWIAERRHEQESWSTPVNLGPPVNGPANDFCPTPLTGNWLLFVSERTGADTCSAGPGSGDIYRVRYNPAHGWSEPQHLGCDADGSGPNFPGPEFGPSLVRTAQGTFLYFSSTGYGTDMDIYRSRMRTDGSFERATPVSELNTAFADFMPNVRRGGLEIVFNSNRSGGWGEQGGQDVYLAVRTSTADPWSIPINLGPAINTGGNETRASLSGDGERLHFGRDGDIYVSYRAKNGG